MEHREALLALRTFLSTQILGQEKLIERLLIALLADGHMLVEGAPGLAKTKAIKELAEGIEAQFHRIQFTPDLLPADITGTEIYRPETGSFVFQQGPIFHNLVLADEINRAPAKVQSALLEAMAERQVSVGRSTYELSPLFLVMATQNPIEQEGTYPLPESPLFLPHPDRSKPMAQDSRNVENQERGTNAVTSTAAPPNVIRIDTSRIREREELPPGPAPGGDGPGGAQAGPNGNGGSVASGADAGGANSSGGNGAQTPNLPQDSLSLQQLKKLVGENGKIVVSLVVWVFSGRVLGAGGHVRWSTARLTRV